MAQELSGTIAQCRFLNRLLQERDITLLSKNNLDDSYFSNYPAVYNFIINHFNTYGVVPDLTTVVDAFPNFEVLKVDEPINFVIDALLMDKNQRVLADNYNGIRSALMSNDTASAVNIAMGLSDKLSHSTKLMFTDITADTSRFQSYLDKCNSFATYYTTTGFPELDSVIGGWDRQEEYATIVSRTNMGKTWWLLAFAKAASKAGLRVGIYSGEMTTNKVAYRIDTLTSHISNSGLTHGDINLRDDYKDYIKDIKQELKGPIFVLTPNDAGGSVGVRKLQTFIEQAELDILFIDQHSLLEDDRRGKSPVERAANISKDIKILQVNKRIPIITVSQQNRMSLDNGAVGTELISQSDRIGQDSTIVIFLEQKDGLATLTLVKSRDSSNFKKLKYAWDINNGKFQFIPEETDATNGEGCDDLRNEYEETDDSNDNFT